MSLFPKAVSDRLLAVSAGTMLAGGGAAIMVSGINGVLIAAVAACITVVLGIYAVGLMPPERPAATIGGLVGLPFVLFLTQLGLWVAWTYAPATGMIFLALGLAGMALAALPDRNAEPTTKTRGQVQPSLGRA